MTDERFDTVAESLGVPGAYTHAAGHRVVVDRATREALLEAMALPGGSLPALEQVLAEREEGEWRRGLPPVVVTTREVPVRLRGGEQTLEIRLADERGGERVWTVSVETLPVESCRGGWQQRRLPLPADVSCGYHHLAIETGGRRFEASLVVTPGRCWLPAALNGGCRLWGLSVQLYGLRSENKGGIGDFADLGTLIRQADSLGAACVGLSPLHALFPELPDRCSPYSPNSRLFLNPLFIAAERSRSAGEGPDLLDYAALTRSKLAAFEEMFAAFRGRPAMERLRTGASRPLKSFALFEALRERFAFTGPRASWIPWWRWPEEYRRPDTSAVAAFARDNAGRIDFHLFLQHEAEEQLRCAGEGAREALPLGLYRDMAVGMDRDGADAWMFQDCLPRGVSVGCPPDLRNPLGQDWGVVPFAPEPLRERANAPFIETLRANMRHAGLLRLDHAFQLLRLYWIPLGAGAARGGYVRYPMADLLGILALESHRNRCAVVAEDLGTIPKGFRETIMDWDTLSSRILHRERGEARSYRPPSSYPERATVATGTHDQATLAGFWRGRDVEVRTQLGLYPSDEAARQAKADRAIDRTRLVEALRNHAGLEGDPGTAGGGPSEDLVIAVHRFLARTPCRLLLVQPDDVTGEVEQVNLPATLDEHPNWRRRYRLAVERLGSDRLMRRLAAMLRQEGRAAGNSR